jgi:hypothetical protein
MTKIFFITLITSVLIGWTNHSAAQDVYTSYHHSIQPDSADTQTIVLKLYNNNFVKNNEYFNPYTEGITYIGSILQPEIHWIPVSSLQLAAGVYTRYYYGRDKPQVTLPVIRATYTISKNYALIFGQLQSRLAHGFEEPIYSTDNYFTRNPEYGVEFMVDKKRFTSDIFMDWERFLLPGEAQQEIITGGWVMNYRLNPKSDFNELNVHFQSLIHHFGGQVDNSDDYLQSRANLALGVSEKVFFSKTSSIKLNCFYLQALELSQSNTLPFDKGYALYATSQFNWKWIAISSGIFHGEYFFSPMGDFLFQSVSEINDWFISETRNIIPSKLLLTKHIGKGMDLSIRFESYFDTDHLKHDYSYGLNLRVDTDIFRRKIKQL